MLEIFKMLLENEDSMSERQEYISPSFLTLLHRATRQDAGYTDVTKGIGKQ